MGNPPDPQEPQIIQDDNTVFVVYVPPTTDAGAESCLRLGAGPAQSHNDTTDEHTTYNDAVGQAPGLSQLSWQTYSNSSGIALVTPGTINMVGTGGVNITSGPAGNTISTIGKSYSVIADGSQVIQASYTDKFGLWSTSNYTQASSVSVNTNLLQASIGLGMMYGVSGPLTCANTWGAMWQSTAGVVVTAQVAKVIAIGARTVVSNAVNGANNEYYTKEQASSTAATFTWQVPVAASYAAFDAMQKVYCIVVDAAAIATSAAAGLYAAVGAGIADFGSPSAVQGWLKDAQPMALACTIIDGLLLAAGLVLGHLVDVQCDNANPLNMNATTFVIAPGSAVLNTKTSLVDSAPRTAPALVLDANTPEITLSLDNVLTGAMLSLTPKLITLGTEGRKAVISMSDDSLVLQFGPTASVTLDAKGIHLSAGGHSVDVTSTSVAIAGQNITIEGAIAQINALQAQVSNKNTGLAATAEVASTANAAAVKVQEAADVLTKQAAAMQRDIAAVKRKLGM
jgi:hypothetical protein